MSPNHFHDFFQAVFKINNKKIKRKKLYKRKIKNIQIKIRIKQIKGLGCENRSNGADQAGSRLKAKGTWWAVFLLFVYKLS